MAHCERKVRNSETGVRMTHQRTKNQLHVHRSRREGTECLNRNALGVRFDKWESAVPAGRREHSQSNYRAKKSLRETRMKGRDPSGQQKNNRQPTEHALKNHCTQSGRAQPTDPDALFFKPHPNRQNHCEKSNERSDQPMTMFVEDASDPFRIRKAEQVPAVGGGPIRNTKPRFRTGDQSADKNQKRGATGGKKGKTVECDVVVVHRCFWKIRG